MEHLKNIVAKSSNAEFEAGLTPYNKAREAIADLIVLLCDEAKARRMRDEYKSYEAIATLMNSLN